MKHKFSLRLALTLVVPLVLGVVLLIGQLGCGSSSSSTPTPVPTTGFVSAGLVDSPSGTYQQLLLNVVSIRLNPSTNSNVLDTDPNWATIPVPPNAGLFSTPADLQIDLNQLQNNVKLFNSSFLTAQTYNQIELQIDQTVPGNIVPNCGVGAPTLEGCISYPAVFPPTLSTFLRTTAQIQVGANGLTPVVIDVSLPQSAILPPTTQGGAFTISPTISVIPATNLLGTVTGTAPPGQTIAAELTGTGTVITTTVPIGGSGTATTVAVPGTWVMQLPASPLGTAYDFFTRGPVGTPFATQAISDVLVTRGTTVGNLNFNGGATTGVAFAGTVAMAVTGTPIPGATVNVGMQAINNANLVIVGTGSTDNTGTFPLPGTAFNPAPLSSLGVGTYQVSISAAGFNPIPFSGGADVALISGAVACSGGIQGSCAFLLSGTQITGNVTVEVPPPAGTTQQVLVMAEDAGTANMENVAMVTIPSGATAAPFTIQVPTTVPSFDMILSAQDQFEGAPSPFPGHTIFVANSIAGGASGVTLGPINCNPGVSGGHGSLSGTAIGSNQNTSIMLFKTPAGGAPVALMSTTVAPQLDGLGQLNPNANQFSFCAPADTYTIERLQSGTLVNGPLAVPLPVPAAQSTPCPSVCGSSFATCPAPCANTAVGPI